MPPCDFSKINLVPLYMFMDINKRTEKAIRTDIDTLITEWNYGSYKEVLEMTYRDVKIQNKIKEIKQQDRQLKEAGFIE